MSKISIMGKCNSSKFIFDCGCAAEHRNVVPVQLSPKAAIPSDFPWLANIKVIFLGLG